MIVPRFVRLLLCLLVTLRVSGALAADAPSTALLLDALRHGDDDLRYESAVRLGELRHASGEVVSSLAAALADPQRRVRLAAATALAHFEQEASPAVPQVIALASSPDAGLRQAALGTLGAIGGGDAAALTTTHAHFDDVDAGVRVAAARASFALSGKLPVEVLRPLLSGTGVDDAVTLHALEALELAGPAAKPLLEAVRHQLTSPHDEIALQASRVLLAARSDPQPALDTWRRLLHRGVGSQRGALEALDRVGAAAAPLRVDVAPLLDSDDAEVRAGALDVLTRLDRSATPHMLELLSRQLDPTQPSLLRVRAAMALWRVGRRVPGLEPALDAAEPDVRLTAAAALLRGDSRHARARLVAVAGLGRVTRALDAALTSHRSDALQHEKLVFLLDLVSHLGHAALPVQDELEEAARSTDASVSTVAQRALAGLRAP
jgi:hypothetical protein